jgi:S1-C subfamily serine protease
VEDSGPAHEAGVLRGDLLVAADGRVLDRIDALYEALDAAAEHGSLELTIVRGTDERVLTVKI